MTDKEIDRIIKANIRLAGFVSLVKKMREAQMRVAVQSGLHSKHYNDLYKEMQILESEVDEWLEKLNK